MLEVHLAPVIMNNLFAVISIQDIISFGGKRRFRHGPKLTWVESGEIRKGYGNSADLPKGPL